MNNTLNAEMVRTNLQNMLGEVITFNAVFIRKSQRNLKYKTQNKENQVETYLLRSLSKNGVEIAEHVWCDSCPALRTGNLKPGDIIEMTAKVSSYVKILRFKGCTTTIKDYGLSLINNVSVIGHNKHNVKSKRKRTSH